MIWFKLFLKKKNKQTKKQKTGDLIHLYLIKFWKVILKAFLNCMQAFH